MVPLMSSSSDVTLSSLLSDVPFQYPVYALLLIILGIYIFRLLRTAFGEKFSETRVFFGPALYCLLVTVSFVGSTETVVLVAFIDSLLGVALGIHLSRNVKIFRKNNLLYYRRSFAVVTLWTSLFALKLITILYLPQYNIKDIFSILLTLATGMVVGEAMRIFYKGRNYEKKGLLGTIPE